jgi:YidC/Oxa1 family membrane protein insertase
MSENNKQSTQSRFFIAAALSIGVLLLWTYFFPPPKKVDNNTNTNANVAVANTQPTPETQPTPVAQQTVQQTPDNTPNKAVSIKSPLYQVKFDSKGAVATSWILVKNIRQGAKPIDLWADGSNETNKIPLELVLQDNPKREFPFRLSTGDQNLDVLLNDKNYKISNEGEINLNAGESKQVDFTLNSGDVEVIKSFTFQADNYLTDLKVTVKRSGQKVENVKLLLGTAIGDQGVKYHDYYHIEPEAVAYVNNTIERHQAASLFKKHEDESGEISVPGEVDWAGIGDSYFAMAAIPANKTQGLEYKATKLTKDVEPHYTGLWSWITRNPTTRVDVHQVTAYVPINSDGSATKIYTGSKDYFTLRDYSHTGFFSSEIEGILDTQLGRTTHLGELINYSNWWQLRWIQRPVAKFLLWCLNGIYNIVGNYGIAIIIFTFIFYSIFFPIRWWQSKQFKKSQANAPKMKEIQDKIKALQKKGVPLDDPRMRELQMEQLKMTKDAIPIAGCLPMLLQIPLFVALYTAVTIGIDFRQASFLWLPDLAGSDPWHILEFLFAGSMAGSMVFTPTTPTVTEEQKMQQKMMTYLMPGMLLFMMWGTSAGLLLYWFFGNIVSFIQQFIINRMNKTAETQAT